MTDNAFMVMPLSPSSKKKVHFQDEEQGKTLCNIHEVESYKKYYQDTSGASCSCSCSIF